jgi:hypothetical protein
VLITVILVSSAISGSIHGPGSTEMTKGTLGHVALAAQSQAHLPPHVAERDADLRQHG